MLFNSKIFFLDLNSNEKKIMRVLPDSIENLNNVDEKEKINPNSALSPNENERKVITNRRINH